MNDFNRQDGIINIKEFQKNNIAIIGCGAIGSFMAISLAKMGLTNFWLWDFDDIEEHNLPNQFFKEADVGSNKAFVTARNIIEFNSEASPKALLTRFITLPKEVQIVISCVDSMKSRKEIFEECKKSKDVQLFIDTRMGGLQGQLYCVDMSKKKEIKNYEKTLFKDGAATPGRCTERSIIFTVLGIVSMACNQIVNALKGDEIKNYIILDYITSSVY